MENRQGEVKNSIGNVETKELICMTHGHELREGNAGGRGLHGGGEYREKKKWDNCNSIINKITFLKQYLNHLYLNSEFY